MDAYVNASSPTSAVPGLLATGYALSSSGLAYVSIATGLVAVYTVVRHKLRYAHVKSLPRKYGFTDRASLANMTHAQAQQIVASITQQEFTILYRTSLQFGIFKTYGIASVSKLLLATKALVEPLNAGKRYEDTVVIFSEFTNNPPTSDRCLRAIARMNYLHSRYRASGQISNEDLLYTLALCMKEPIRFINLYEWRTLSDIEICAIGVFWKSLGDAMGIDYGCLADVPGYTPPARKEGAGKDPWADGIEFVENVTAWAIQYERDFMRPAPQNIKTSRRLVDLLLYHVPSAMRPFAVEALTVFMSERVRDAFSYPEPGLTAKAVVYSTLFVRRLYLKYLALPRFRPYRQTAEEADPVTGRVHLNEYLVQPWYMKPTFWARWGPIGLLTRLLGGTVPGEQMKPPVAEDGAKAPTLPSGCERFLAEGFLVDELGPLRMVNVGAAETAAEAERLRSVRTTGCPFA